MAWNPVGTPQQTRQAQNVGLVNGQSIHDFKFATRQLAAGVVPAITNFFGAAPSSDGTVDRYEQGNTLVSSMKQFTIYSMGVQLLGGAGAVLTDFEKLINFTGIRLITAQKEYGYFPLHILSAGGGLAIQSGQVAVTPAASPGALSTIGATNGMPSNEAMFALAIPLIIQANQSFYAELVGGTAAGLLGTQTLTGVMNLRVLLSGIEDRAGA
jgi:hypothetical protein